MDIETAMEYISDIYNVYLQFIPVTETTRKSMKEALNLSLSALKTIQDMKCNSASVYGSFITKGE